MGRVGLVVAILTGGGGGGEGGNNFLYRGPDFLCWALARVRHALDTPCHAALTPVQHFAPRLLHFETKLN
jgi:hypothetical protein